MSTCSGSGSPSASPTIARVTWARFIGGIDPDGWGVSDETSKHWKTILPLFLPMFFSFFRRDALKEEFRKDQASIFPSSSFSLLLFFARSGRMTPEKNKEKCEWKKRLRLFVSFSFFRAHAFEEAFLKDRWSSTKHAFSQKICQFFIKLSQLFISFPQMSDGFDKFYIISWNLVKN